MEKKKEEEEKKVVIYVFPLIRISLPMTFRNHIDLGFHLMGVVLVGRLYKHYSNS